MKDIESLTIQDVINRTGRDGEPWRLAIVQRERVWDADKAARLFDSLLAGYPIGTLLLCRTLAPSVAIARQDGRRVVVDASGDWQVLDGQQRIWAISTLFGATRENGDPEFFFRPEAKREELKPGARDPKIHKWVTWQDASRDPFRGQKADRAAWVSARAVGRALAEGRISTSVGGASCADAQAWFAAADPEYRPRSDLDPESEARVVRCHQGLLTAWSTRFIPVQRIELDDPVDVLEVFERVNMEGIRTSAADIFFAGVKTRWHDAEEGLDGFRASKHPALPRMDALRIVARGASIALGAGDPVPLHVKRLQARNGEILVERMNTFAYDPQARLAVARTLDDLTERMGYALRLVERHLLDVVLLWCIRRYTDGRPEAVDDRALSRAAAYLFWGTALRLYQVFRDTYGRKALAATKEATEFPLEDLFSFVQKDYPTLSYQQMRIPLIAKGGPSERRRARQDCVNARAGLFLSVAQQIPFKPAEPLDWDHILPQSARSQLKWPGKGARPWLQYHPNSGAILRAGNLAGLNASLNRMLQDTLPREKFKVLRRHEPALGGGIAHEPELVADLFLTGIDRRRLLRIESLLPVHDGHAPDLLAAFVADREDAIWRAAVAKFPDIATIVPALYGDGVTFTP